MSAEGAVAPFSIVTTQRDIGELGVARLLLKQGFFTALSGGRRRRHPLRASPAYLRWGLLFSSAAMAAVLVATGLWVCAGIVQAAAAVTRGQAITIAFAGRRALRSAAQLNRQALQEVLDELSPQGLRYLEVGGPDQGQELAAGKKEEGLWVRTEQLTPVVGIAFDKKGARARLHMIPQDGAAPASRHLFAEPPVQPGENHSLRGREITFEVESAGAGGLASRADATFAVSLLAAATLLGLCAVFWRMSRRAEKASLQLEHDRQLKLLGQMSAVLGHEIRNPLASLKGHVQLLLEKLPVEHAGRRGAEVVLHEAMRLEELSRQVLEFARTGSVQCEDADPAAVVRSAVESAGSEGVRLHMVAAPPVWRLDGRRIEEVIVNLLRNARDASAPEQPIDVTVEGQPDNLLIEVRDRGEGIVAGEEERVFEAFYTRRVKGTGLGLALARRIVEGHGGSITARNHPAGGAVFSVSLPGRAQGA
jgi:two-component system sensor histidine kinase HydH